MANLMFDSDASGLGIHLEESLNESGNIEKKYYIQGIFSTIGEPNKNHRVYSADLWQREVANYQKEINEGTINTLMEYEHPARTEVDPMKAVAKILSLKIDGKYVMGKAVLLDNPQANQLKSLIQNGVKISVSSRGVGSVENGLVKEFKLITYDVVPNPSDFNATMNGVCEGHTITEGIILDRNFEEDKYGNLVECEKKSEPVEEKQELTLEEKQQIIKDKMNAILDKI